MATVNFSSHHWEANFIVQMENRRKRLGMTQTDLANRLRAQGLPFHQQTVQRVESGERPLRLDEAFVIAELLGSDMTTMTRRMREEVRDAYYAVDRLRRRSESVVSNAMDDWSEWSEVVNELLLTFQEEFERTGPTPNPLLTWLAAWVSKAIWADQSYEELVLYLHGISSSTGDWREEAPRLVRGAPEYYWVDSPIDLWLSLPQKLRPDHLSDLSPQDLYDYLSALKPDQPSEPETDG